MQHNIGRSKKMKGHCRDCSIALFGIDRRDFAQMMPDEGYGNGSGPLVKCECCGPMAVDINGRRIGEPFHESCHCREMLGTRHFPENENIEKYLETMEEIDNEAKQITGIKEVETKP